MQKVKLYTSHITCVTFWFYKVNVRRIGLAAQKCCEKWQKWEQDVGILLAICKHNVDIVARSNLENQRFRNTTTHPCILLPLLGVLVSQGRKMTKKLLFHGNWLFDFSAAFLEIVPVCIHLFSLSHVYMTYGIPTPSMPVEPLRDKDIRYILWLVFKVCVSKHDIILFKFFKKLVNINFMYNVRCTNFKSWSWNK